MKAITLSKAEMNQVRKDVNSWNEKSNGRGYQSFLKEVRKRYSITPSQLDLILNSSNEDIIKAQKEIEKQQAKKAAKKNEIRSNVNKGITKDGEKKSGVIQTILNQLKKKPQTQETLLKELVKEFPDRDSDSMKQTIKAQIGGTKRPTRLERKRGIELRIEIKTVKDKEQILYTYVGLKNYDEEEAAED